MAGTETLNQSYIGLRTNLLRHVRGTGLKVLDLGCATGANGRYLRDQGVAIRVLGVELDDVMAAEAEKVYDHVLTGNLDDPKLLSALGEELFDYILAGDVLEHLRDPQGLLQVLRSRLAEGGRVIISVPNVQHLETFIQVYVHGRWPYNDRGLFDRTHLRFLTASNLMEWIASAGLRAERVERRYRFRDQVGSRFPLHTGGLLCRLFPNLFTHQYIAICVAAGPGPVDAKADDAPAPSVSRHLQE